MASLHAPREPSLAPSVPGGGSAPGQPAIPPHLRRLILRTFTRKYGLQLHASALHFVLFTLAEHELLDDPEQCEDAIEELARRTRDRQGAGDEPSSSVITRATLEAVYEQILLSTTTDPGPHGQHGISDALVAGEKPDANRHFDVIDAFDMPKIDFDHVRKVFEKSATKPTILGPSSSKPAYLYQRLAILRSIILRNENFLPPLAIGQGRARDAFMKLASTKNLLGRQGQRFLLFGLLTTTEDGRYALEDADGQVGLDLEDAIPGEGIFTEGTFILVEGEYTDDERIRAFAIGHPPSENRETARSMFAHVDFLGTGAISLKEEATLRSHEQLHPDLSFVFISDLHLDHPKSLVALRAMLRGYMDADFIPFAFVICGNFMGKSYPGGEMIKAYQDGFAALGDVLHSFPQIVQQAHFIFQPGPRDPFATPTLPRAALPSIITDKLIARVSRGGLRTGNVRFVSNPARLTYFGQEIVLCRDDVMARMLRNTVRCKQDVKEGDLKKFLVSTILDQAHLCPLPQSARPILWEHDHALRLYPMPSALVLADSYDGYELTYEGCHVFNPSSFRKASFGWTTYYPSSRRAEKSELPGV